MAPIEKPLPPDLFDRFGTNAETRLESLAEVGDTVPNDRFFVRNHSATPVIDAAAWRLRVFGDGLTGDAVELSLSDLERLPNTSLTACIECAGNGRSFFAGQQGTPAPGTQWALGGVGVAEWRGVLLSEVLERAGIAKSAVDLLPEGLDANVVSGGVDLGKVRRPLPAAKALDDVLLAYEMNGAELPPDHGFPVRLVVPGWVGIASIKWLGRIEVSARPLFSPWNTTSYRMFGPDYPADSPPLTNQPVKSALELARGAVLPLGRRTTLTGRAWSGTAPIRRVEVSTDRGATWAEAMIYGGNRPGAWTRWRFKFEPSTPGPSEIWTRATDENGRTQPPSVPFNTFGYLYSAVVRHPIDVQ